jgi:hypothetical protein
MRNFFIKTSVNEIRHIPYRMMYHVQPNCQNQYRLKDFVGRRYFSSGSDMQVKAKEERLWLASALGQTSPLTILQIWIAIGVE